MFEREERDPYGFNNRKKGEKIKIYLPTGYCFCGNTPKEYSKYLPCIAILTSHCGDCFYGFKIITEDGVKKAYGYAHGFTEKQILEGDDLRTKMVQARMEKATTIEELVRLF